jgi:hypothetical protein
MKTIVCECCADNGERVPATWVAPSSTDAGKTVDFSPICDAHANGWWDGADWDGRHLMQKLEQPEKRVWMLLSPEERLAVQEMRARAMTGYDVHVASHPAPRLDERVPFGYYIWRMGEQPNKAWIARMACADPVQAARLFLKHYKAYHEVPVPAGHHSVSTYTDPEVR